MRESVSAVGVLDKAVSILTALEAQPLALADLASKTALPRATAHRLAVALERHGLVGRDGGGRFTLGPRLGELALAGGTGRRTLADLARPALVMLRDATGEGVAPRRTRGRWSPSSCQPRGSPRPFPRCSGSPPPG